jgi:hypothetical protein
MRTMNRIWAVLITSLVILIAAGAASSCARGGTGAATRLHDAGAWCNFGKMNARSGGNHPDYYSAECKGGKLSVSFSIVYGTDQAQLTLDLSTREISGARTQQSREEEIVAKPPDRGGDYFSYQSQLKTVASVPETMIGLAGEWGNKGIDIARLRDALSYVKNLSAQVAALPGIDRIKPLDPQSIILGLKNTVRIEYKVSAARDILIVLGSPAQTYAQTRITVASGVGAASAALDLPLTVQGAATASLIITIVPHGADASGKLDEVASPVTLEKGDQIFNLYTDNRDSEGTAANNLYAGKENHFYTNWRVVRDRDLLFRLIDRNGQVWAEKRLLARVGGDDSAHVSLFIPESTLRKSDEYQLVMRIVIVNGSWDQMLDERVGDFNRRLTVK